MLSLAFIREHADAVRQMLADRRLDAPLDAILSLDAERRALLVENEGLKQQRNEVSGQIAKMKEKPAELLAEMGRVRDRTRILDEQQREIDRRLDDLLLRVPNLPDPSTPVGASEDDNVVVSTWSESPLFDFEPKHHWDIGENLGILDPARAAKMSGSRFNLLMGSGALLERALAQFMLDIHTREHGYTEVSPPYLVSTNAMIGTGQYPKFVETDGAYKIDEDDLYLIPTAEVSVTNLHREEILDVGTLPRKYVACTPSFRREAGSAGADTRGLIRLHQFLKVELVRFEEPARSADALEELLHHATEILRRLGLHYRVVEKCTADLGFTAAKTYDPEVWMPAQGRYREISSVSTFGDFQARRARIQYRPAPGQRAELVNTLNGSALAVGRTLAAVLENYQQADGSVTVPEALRPYLGTDRVTGV